MAAPIAYEQPSINKAWEVRVQPLEPQAAGEGGRQQKAGVLKTAEEVVQFSGLLSP